MTSVSGNATVVAKLVSTLAGSNWTESAGVVLADSANGASTTPAVELGVYGFTTNSNGQVTDNGTIDLTAQLANGSSYYSSNPLASVNVGTPFTLDSDYGVPDETYNPPVWLKLVEAGSGSSTVFTGYYSMDGVNWTEVGATTAGEVSFSHSTNVAGVVSTNLARFTNVSASPLWFSTPPTASPATVTGTTCQLSAQGQSSAGNSGITYTWSTTTAPVGASPPTFSANGTNAASATTATFHAAGTYVLTATMADSAGNVAAETVTVVVDQKATSVVVSPSPVNLASGAEQTLYATLDDQFGAAISYSGFTWAVTGNGTISSSGNFTAPTNRLETDTVTAASSIGSIQGTATINVLATPASLTAAPVSGTEIDLSWPAVSGATGYNVYRGTGYPPAGGGGEALIAANVSGPTYQDKSLSGQTTYYYVVRAVNASETGAASAQALATNPPPYIAFSDADIGSPQQKGSLKYASGSGVYTVAGGGDQIWGSSDSFNFASVALSGDGSIAAQVASVHTPRPGQRGLMFRDSTAANAAMAMLAVAPSGGLTFETRATNGGLVSAQLVAGFMSPIWLRLCRGGRPVHGLLFYGQRTQRCELDRSRLGGRDIGVS